MDSSTPTSSRRRGPVITKIVVDLNKAYGEVPASFSSIYGNQIGPVVSITDPRGNNFSVGFTKRQAYGKLTKGWSDLLSFYSLSDNDIISLHYIGDIYFRMSIMDNNRQEIQYPHPTGDNPQVESDNSSDSEPPPIDCNITLSKYMVSGSQLFGQELSYPPDFDNWIEKSFLFKVEVKSTSSSQFEPSFRVKRVCTDASVIKQFKDTESACSPKEGVFTTGLSVSDVIVSTELPDVDSGIAKDLMSQFCDSEMCVQSEMGNTPPICCPAKRSSNEGVGLPNDDLSSTKLKAVKIEKD